RAMSKNAANRYASAADMAQALQGWLDTAQAPLSCPQPIFSQPLRQPLPGKSQKRLSHGWNWCRKNPLPAAFAGGTVSAVIVGSILLQGLAVNLTKTVRNSPPANTASTRSIGKETVTDVARTDKSVSGASVVRRFDDLGHQEVAGRKK